MGIAMMLKTPGLWLGHFWIVFGLLGFASTFAIGLGVLAPLSKRIVATIAERAPHSPEAQALIKRILIVARVDTAILLLVIVDMVAKPFSSGSPPTLVERRRAERLRGNSRNISVVSASPMRREPRRLQVQQGRVVLVEARRRTSTSSRRDAGVCVGPPYVAVEPVKVIVAVAAVVRSTSATGRPR